MGIWLRRLARAGGRIGVRLMIVNAVVLVIPIFGLEFARVYERQLLASLERDMKNQAAIVRAEVEVGLKQGRPVDDVEHEQMLERAATTTRTRVRILNADGAVVSDSHRQGPPEGPEPPSPKVLGDLGSGTRARGEDLGPTWPDVPDRTEVTQAVSGKPATRTRFRGRAPAVLLFLAEPIRSDGAVVGVVYVTRSTQPVMYELYRIRTGLIRVLAIALAITAMITLALAWSISRPLSRLSRAAKRIAGGERNVVVPIGGSGEVRDLCESFSSMKGRLDGRLRYISEFAADVAHEFKSPLTSIRGAAELLGEGAADDPDARQRFLRNIELDADRLDRLVTRLLVLSRIEASHELMGPVDLGQMMDRVAKRTDNPKVKVNVTVHPGAHWVHARGPDVETAVVNLVENAIRYSPAGGQVDVDVSKSDSHVLVEVVDRGPGIDEAIRARIFDRFFTTDADRDGTGLGLSIVRTVAEAHGGRVELAPQTGEGARFRLYLAHRPR